MGKVCYIEKKFNSANQLLVDYMNRVVREYQHEGYDLTVRQLYYQLVARDVIPNNLQEYKRIASIINDAKLAGQMDWDAIVDRTREFITQPHWGSGADIVEACVQSYNQDRWANQDIRMFVIVEKEALVGVLDRTCKKYDVPLLAARGYPSGTVLREFAEKMLLPAVHEDKGIVILHLGDHDPSGIDMTRDLTERLQMFTYGMVGNGEINRIALTMDQVEEIRPPENPAKLTDSRVGEYVKLYGSSSWELDALSPSYLNDLLEEHISAQIDEDAWDSTQAEIDDVKARLVDMAAQFNQEDQ